ncbi:MAG: isoleucine--tRNA ligase [Bacteriovoracaceae bacterium]|nr:isoleucine--tRNA ligase [Bacteriovoracaceae bacterium]
MSEENQKSQVQSCDPFSFVQAELDTIAFWQKQDIFKKSLEQTSDCPPYIFYDGPPFATGLPHHGHLVGSTLKDIIPRYFTMKGRYVERRFGWDCHGLPIEHEIDKKLGMSAQNAIKKLGIKGYNDECRSIVQRFTSEWEQTITRLGRFVDFENDYKTMDTSFMESVWWVFKRLWDKDLIYEGTRVVPFSTSLGTVLSNFEAGQNYQDVQDPAITVLFKVEDEDAYFAAWTTTPWTLPSNLCLCVGANIDYVKVKDEDKEIEIYLAKDLVESFSKKRTLTIVKELKGADLKGKKYEPLFPYFKDLAADGAFQVLNDDYVTIDAGTGIVHTAPGFGEDDNRIMKEAGLGEVFTCPVDDQGCFTDEIIDYKGIFIKETDKPIIKRLKEEGKLFDQSVIMHSYPFCYRSDTPLIYKAIPSWYVSVEKIKDKLLASNKQINWVPDHIRDGRFGKWLEGARDWSISRNRIWGTPLPVWKNDSTGNFLCIGSIEELKKYTGVELDDLHRESVDDLNFSIDGEEGTYKRITEVLDCWFESGSMPYAQLHYPFENADIFEKGFPAEFIAEGLDQTRGWVYTLTILSSALFDKPAFKNVIVNGIVMAEDGKKMSKRLSNYTPPDKLMQEYGADALRLYLINSGLVRGEEQKFSDTGVKDMVRRALLPWFNSYKFLSTYANVDNFNVSEHLKSGNNILDRWVLSNLQTLKQNIGKEMESYRLYNVLPALFAFIEDLTNWYIRLNRARFWGEGLSDDKCAAYSTLFTAVKEICLTMAPFSPFLSEHIYRELSRFEGSERPESVHLCSYPVADEKLMDHKLEDAVSRLQQIILLGRQKRNQVQIKVKMPLSTLTIIHKDQSLLDEIHKLESYIKTELNVKNIEYTVDEAKYIKFYSKPNSRVLGKRFGREFGKFKKLIEALSHQDISSLEEKGTIEIKGESFNTDDILLFREAKEGSEALSNRFISINLDCTLSADLIQEGLAREVVNRIQKTRKELNFNVDDRINIAFKGSDELEKAITIHKDYISQETLALSLMILEGSQSSSTDQLHQFSIDNFELELKITRS